MEAMTLERALELGYRAGFIAACNWPAPVSQDVDSPAFVADLCQFVSLHTPITAHLAQPAQAVDVRAVRRVIAELEGYCEASEGSCYGTLSTDLVRGYTQQLSGAIQGLGDDGWKLVPLELTPEMAAAASAAVWPVASAEDREKARAAALIVLKTTMELVPGATLDSLAAGIATMFPAYRAFIAAAPTRALSGEKAGPVVDGVYPVSVAPKDAPSHSIELLVYLPEHGWRRGFYTGFNAERGEWPWSAETFPGRTNRTITHWTHLPARITAHLGAEQ